MKFVVNKRLTDSSVEYKNIDQAKQASLALELFNFSYVKEIFVSENYISITKDEFNEYLHLSITDKRKFVEKNKNNIWQKCN